MVWTTPYVHRYVRSTTEPHPGSYVVGGGDKVSATSLVSALPFHVGRREIEAPTRERQAKSLGNVGNSSPHVRSTYT